MLSHLHRFSQSQNQGRTPLTSNISGLAITSQNSPTNPILTNPHFQFEYLHRRTAIPTGTTLHRKDMRNNDQNSFSLISNRPRKLPSSSRQRKLPRDLELNKELYKITNENSFRRNYTNNALSSSSNSHQSTTNVISFENVKTNEDIDSSV